MGSGHTSEDVINSVGDDVVFVAPQPVDWSLAAERHGWEPLLLGLDKVLPGLEPNRLGERSVVAALEELLRVGPHRPTGPAKCGMTLLVDLSCLEGSKVASTIDCLGMVKGESHLDLPLAERWWRCRKWNMMAAACRGISIYVAWVWVERQPLWG